MIAFMLCGAMIAPIATTATLKGRVPVLKRNATLAKEYGAQPSFRVEPPDAPTSAVWVGSGAPALDPATAKVARIEQRGFQFRPALMVVQTGTPVVFPNEDPLYHSVFSLSDVKRFDLGRFRKGEEPEAIVFDKAGQVPVFCEIHNHMRATLVVVDTPWIAQSKPDGSFEIAGIAPGTYTATIWLSPKQQVVRSITLAAGQTLDVDWSDADDVLPP
jgi:plastocyanin